MEYFFQKYANLVVVLSPDLHPSPPLLLAQIPDGCAHKVIECETEPGCIHVLRHLSSDLVILPSDIPSSVAPAIRNFVTNIKILSTDIQQANNEIQGLLTH